MDILQEAIIAKFNYWVYIILMMIGLYAMIAKNNLLKKLVGMTIFQTGIILFYVSIGVKAEARIPILTHEQMPGDHEAGARAPIEETPAHPLPDLNPNQYANPIPHVLMLTAIVVGVSTLGVGLSIAQRVYQVYGTLEEDEILASIQRTHDGVIDHD